MSGTLLSIHIMILKRGKLALAKRSLKYMFTSCTIILWLEAKNKENVKDLMS